MWQIRTILPLWNSCWYYLMYRSSAPGKFCVVWGGKDIRYYGLLIDVDTEDLSPLVDTNDTVGCLMLCSYKDSLAGNTVHVYTSARFEIIKVNKTVLRVLKC